MIIICCDALRFDHFNNVYMPKVMKRVVKGTNFINCLSGGGDTLSSLPYFLSSQKNYDININLPSILSKNGYETAMIHCNPVLRENYSHGFDISLDFMDTLERNVGRKIRKIIGRKTWRRTLNFRRVLINDIDGMKKTRKRPYIRTEFMLDACQDWIDNTTKDYFLWCHLMDAHIPYSPLKSSLGLADERIVYLNDKILKAIDGATNAVNKYNISKQEKKEIMSLYADEIKYLDQHISKFMDQNDALFVLTADHGDEFGEYGGYSHGGYDYHGLIPQLIHIPLAFVNRVKPQTQNIDVSSMDVAPTLLDLLGIKEKIGYGNSLKGVLV